MIKHIKELHNCGLIDPDPKIVKNTMLQVKTGSVAYGVDDENSDIDIFGVVIPTLEDIFPSFYGKIYNYDNINTFKQYNKTDIQLNGVEYDIQLMDLISYFKLLEKGNPNCINVIFSPDDVILHNTSSSSLLRKHKHDFLQKRGYEGYIGFATSEFKRIVATSENPSNVSNEKRRELIDTYGYDVKRGYHVVRLLLQIIQILESHTLDIRKDSALLKDVRNGSMTLKELERFYKSNVEYIDKLVIKSTLRETSDPTTVRNILKEIIGMYYNYDPEYKKIIKTFKEVKNIE